MRYILGAALLILGCLFLLGCPPKQKPVPPGPGPSTGPSTTTSPVVAPTAKGTPVIATLTEKSIVLKPATIPAGPVTFTIDNKAKTAQGIEIGGTTNKVASIDPGKTATLAVGNLKAGKYTVYSIDNHGKRGMKATLTVTAAKTTAAPATKTKPATPKPATKGTTGKK